MAMGSSERSVPLRKKLLRLKCCSVSLVKACLRYSF
jgi:hypothetical protein